MSARYFSAFLLLTALLFLNIACSDDDDPTGPGNITVTDPRVEPLKDEGTALAQDIIATIPALAQGQLGNKDETEPYFDPTCTCWRWGEYDGDYTDPLFSWERSTSYTGTFMNGGVPQMEFEGADAIDVTLYYSYYESTCDDVEEKDANRYSSKSVNFNLNLQVTEFSDDPATLTGTGTGSVSGGEQVGEEWEGFYEEIEVTIEMTVPFAGCPSGSIDLDMEEASFSMGFNGSSSASWSYAAGEGDPLTGTFTIICSME
jgi:hypothetical protein